MLVNGLSIYYDKSISSYDYYHVETEQHSIIKADGMLTESCLDTVNRSSFLQESKISALSGVVQNWGDKPSANIPQNVDLAFIELLYRTLEWRAIWHKNCNPGN
ncbi:hypothetical protein AA0482_1310 [Acetobacter cibinongensis NRIC 0482]|nr:hypothetical protein AA0482_1310 [Acetobacter cibinongensis NRIC 0482]